MFSGTNNFKEAIEKKAVLPEDDAGAFRLFLEWLYAGRFSKTSASAWSKKSCSVEEADSIALDRINLYAMAEKWVLRDLMDYTMTTIIVGYEAAAQLVCTGTAPGSELRTFIADTVTGCLLSEEGIPQPTKHELAKILALDVAMGEDVVKRIREGDDGYREWEYKELIECEHHVHSSSQDSNDVCRHLRLEILHMIRGKSWLAEFGGAVCAECC